MLIYLFTYLAIRDPARWSLTGNRKQKNMSNFWPKKWSLSFKEFTVVLAYGRVFETVFVWETKRLFVKWSLTGGSRLREVVAMRELTVFFCLQAWERASNIAKISRAWCYFSSTILGIMLLFQVSFWGWRSKA